ncbi:MAG TPA: TMEM175 family protein [Pyrinomonadaceae bacterium]|nr:TMEM175 family protein [Pyrinomonadaceae bacterium]
MSRSRMEAFSDGVIAIIITIMVLELRVPIGASLSALRPLTPVFLSYILSFVLVGIYWSNHHHLFQVVERVSGGVLWANLHLLFWLSLIPFATAWMGENHFAAVPVAAYGVVLVFAAIAYFILTRTLLRIHTPDSTLATALGRDFKGKVSILIYLAAISLAFVRSWLAAALYVLVEIVWLVPDRRIEKRITSN